MKIYPYLLTALIICSISCRKDAALKPEQPADPYLLQQAKDWYSNQQKLSAAPGAVDLKAYTPDWSKANIVKNSKGQNILGLSLFRSPQVYMELNVVIANGKPFGIFKKYVETKDKKDQLNIYSGNGQLITRANYNRQNHLLTSIDPPGMKVMKEKEQEPVPAPGEEPGSGGGGGTDPGPGPIGFSYQGAEITITIPADPPGYQGPSPSFGGGGFDIPFPSFPIGGGGDPYSDFPHGGGGGGNYNPAPVPVIPTSPTPPPIKDSIDAQFECAKELLAMLPTLKSDIAKIVYNTFNSQSAYTLTFINGETNYFLANPNTDGYTEHISPTESKIALNPNVLNNASNEYILATMYHEALHGFLFAEFTKLGEVSFKLKYPDISIKPSADQTWTPNPQPNFSIDEGSYFTPIVDNDPQHRTMAVYFTTELKNAILAYNPNFPPDRAMALARGGIFNDAVISTSDINVYYNSAERDRTKGNAVGKTCTP